MVQFISPHIAPMTSHDCDGDVGTTFVRIAVTSTVCECNCYTRVLIFNYKDPMKCRRNVFDKRLSKSLAPFLFLIFMLPCLT